MGVYCEEMCTSGVTAGHNKVGANVSLVSEEVLLQHRHDSGNSGLAASGERMELEVGRDEGGREFGVCCGTGACAPDLRGDVVELFAVLWRSCRVSD